MKRPSIRMMDGLFEPDGDPGENGHDPEPDPEPGPTGPVVDPHRKEAPIAARENERSTAGPKGPITK